MFLVYLKMNFSAFTLFKNANSISVCTAQLQFFQHGMTVLSSLSARKSKGQDLSVLYVVSLRSLRALNKIGFLSSLCIHSPWICSVAAVSLIWLVASDMHSVETSHQLSVNPTGDFLMNIYIHFILFTVK